MESESHPGSNFAQSEESNFPLIHQTLLRREQQIKRFDSPFRQRF